MNDPNSRDGFTLAELVVVVFTVALLAALAQPNLQRAVLKARAAEAVSDLHVVRVGVLNHHADANAYPPDVNRGQVPASLVPYLPDNFSFARPHYTIDYDNWSAKKQGFVGLTIITDDQALGLEMVNLLGPNAWTNGKTKFTWVVEWTK